MASIFTYQEEPPRVHSPWSTPGCGTPQSGMPLTLLQNALDGSYTTSITKLEPERQDGPTEYKLHLLLRPRGSIPITSVLAKESRQARLQQLTTQLLWRLQQSSPFHSSSNADLVLPILPDATPRLGIPDKPARLLPGLEESQGALYEIGVADDGTLVGLVEEELEESLTNLRAMAASLGCVVDILRRVVVGQFEGKEVDSIVRVWVAEVLVRPDTDSPKVPPLEVLTLSTSLPDLKNDNDLASPAEKASTEQMRVTFVGASTAGKSSLVGTLTSSALDNGRGKSRLALLKHRHEIASGITSSVAQELIGYKGDTDETAVVNYASGDVSSWPDIHGLSHRLVFLSDSPGLPRYAKSTFRTLVSWDPHWTLLCISADEVDLDSTQTQKSRSDLASSFEASSGNARDSIDVSLVHLDICLKLDRRLVIVVTKMDLATKTGLKSTLSRILSALKQAGKVPMLLGAPSSTSTNMEDADTAAHLCQLTQAEQNQLNTSLQSIRDDHLNKLVPIVLTSAVTGVGFGKLHKLLKELPVASDHTAADSMSDLRESNFHIDEIFAIPPSRVYSASKKDHSADQGIVLCGHLKTGKLSVGDHVRLGPFWLEQETSSGGAGDGITRSASYSIDLGRRPPPSPLSGGLSKSLQGDRIKISGQTTEITAAFVDVRVVSVRSLRLSVRSMFEGETGTVGVQPLDQSSVVPLSRARKGMILNSRLADDLAGYRSFTAAFSSSHFSSMDSAPLILGGHAIVYVNSIRAAVKVVAVRLDEDANTEPSSPTELFDFDGENSTNSSDSHHAEIRITFRFVSSVERIEMGNKVLVIPTMTAAGPVSGPPVATVSGLSGFVGRIAEIST